MYFICVLSCSLTIKAFSLPLSYVMWYCCLNLAILRILTLTCWWYHTVPCPGRIPCCVIISTPVIPWMCNGVVTSCISWSRSALPKTSAVAWLSNKIQVVGIIWLLFTEKVIPEWVCVECVSCDDWYAPLSVGVAWLCKVVVISLCVVNPLLIDVAVLVPWVGKAIPVLILLLLLVIMDVCGAGFIDPLWRRHPKFFSGKYPFHPKKLLRRCCRYSPWPHARMNRIATACLWVFCLSSSVTNVPPLSAMTDKASAGSYSCTSISSHIWTWAWNCW